MNEFAKTALVCALIAGSAIASAVEEKGVVLVPLEPGTNVRSGESFESWSLSPTGLPPALVGDPWAFDFSGTRQVVPSGWPIEPTFLEKLSGPSWMGVSGAWGLSGIAAGPAGSQSVSLRGVSGRYGPTDAQSYSLTVNDWRLNPTTLPDAARTQDYSFSLTGQVDIFPGSYSLGGLSWSATGLPAGLQLRTNQPYRPSLSGDVWV